MEADYIKAAVPDPIVLLGLRLKPFCLGHYNLLYRFDCSFVVGGLPTIPDLLLGALVCHQTFEDGYEFFADPNWPNQVKRWQEKLTGAGKGKKPRVIEWPEKFLLFSDYLRTGSKPPETEPTEVAADSEEANSPWQERLMLELWKINPHWTESQLLNMPLSLAWYRTLTAAESRGVVRFEDDMRRMMREDYAKAKAEQEGAA